MYHRLFVAERSSPRGAKFLLGFETIPNPRFKRFISWPIMSEHTGNPEQRDGNWLTSWILAQSAGSPRRESVSIWYM